MAEAVEPRRNLSQEKPVIVQGETRVLAFFFLGMSYE
jgi:hypothetical protein